MKYSFLTKLAGNFKKHPGDARLGWEAEHLIERAFMDIPDGEFIDCHTHLAGLGKGGTGCWINPDILNMKHPLDRFKLMNFINAAAIDDLSFADQQYLLRFRSLVRDFPYGGKFMLLAMDKAHSKDGEASTGDTKLYVPNDYIWEVYQSDPQHFIPCISVHPYRRDAVEELEKWAKRGVRAIKWLPNCMGMNPADARCEPFYEKMKEYDMVLLSHVGKESAIEVIKFKQYGNPLLLRKPLDMGVKVIAAHCASLGMNFDIDSTLKLPTKNFNLFMRLMEEKQYEGLLFADISALTQLNRMGIPLKTMLERTDLHHRLINGSDYPLPAVNAAVSTMAFASLGFLNAQERKALNQIYKRNPLLFDFVLKRTLKHPLDREKRFAGSIFRDNPLLQLSRPLKEEAAGRSPARPASKSGVKDYS
jgi:predicted TIM-barrel fold metal-dependent hydrolase